MTVDGRSIASNPTPRLAAPTAVCPFYPFIANAARRATRAVEAISPSECDR